ncbi:MAG: hypothetical protein LBG62_03750 [Candidatus Methanoplasma sp.]|jgi:hypothetical protein|nr:hypothetical protein [Candidatus Methanoplasma sp.]
MAMIDIEYRRSSEPRGSGELRRKSVEEMSCYLEGLVLEMRRADISAELKVSEAEGANEVLVNGRRVQDILEGLEIRMPEVEESCDLGRASIVRFERPTLDWDEDCIEDIPDILVKNAISKVFAEIIGDRTV